MAGEKELGATCYRAFSGEGATPYEMLSEEERDRWEAAGEAAGEKFMQQEGFAFDPLAYRWTQPGAKGPAVNWNRTTGA